MSKFMKSKTNCVGLSQRFYKVPLDADCSNSNVMHNFEAGGWKKLDFIPRNLVKMIGGNVNKGRNESTKTNFSPV